jgi:hypothetical protein
MIYYYRLHKDKDIVFSTKKIKELQEIESEEISAHKYKYIYYLQSGEWQKVNPLVTLIHPEQISSKKREINILQKPGTKNNDFNIFPEWVREKIARREVGLCCNSYPRWRERLEWRQPDSWKINLIGLGNVGATLLTALRLLGGEKIVEIGIFDTNEKAVSRCEQEVNQIYDGSNKRKMPNIKTIQTDEVFQADMVVFCISIGVPAPEKEVKDVRMMQLEANSRIINYYAQRARKVNFNGIFAILSDPVDLLCQSALLTSNYNEKGEYDGKGLSADQIRGFGLGVMHGRAVYYARENKKIKDYIKKGRVFGPHGKGLIAVDDVEEYNREYSHSLTEKILNANLKLRKIGYKPYIAPAVSSGALSLLDFINCEWHYSAGFLGGIFWGSRNRLNPVGIEWEQYDFSTDLYTELNSSYQFLKKQVRNLEK